MSDEEVRVEDEEVWEDVILRHNVSSIVIPRGTSNLRLSWLHVASDAGQFFQYHHCHSRHLWKLSIPHRVSAYIRNLDLVLDGMECFYR